MGTLHVFQEGFSREDVVLGYNVAVVCFAAKYTNILCTVCIDRDVFRFKSSLIRMHYKPVMK
jgi:hypothetical protein